MAKWPISNTENVTSSIHANAVILFCTQNKLIEFCGSKVAAMHKNGMTNKILAPARILRHYLLGPFRHQFRVEKPPEH